MMKKAFKTLTIFSFLFILGCSHPTHNPGGDDPIDPPGPIDPHGPIEPIEDGLWDSTQDELRTGKHVIDFYNLNDMHGAVLYNAGNYEPGIAKISTFLLKKQSLNPEGYVFTNSGDMWQGSAESNLTKGKLVDTWLDYLSCSAMAIGNHEFDWTIDAILENDELTHFPLLACNIIYKETNEPVEWAKPYTTITRNGVHIGIIGAIGENITGSISSRNVKGLKFDDPTSYVKKHASYLREEGADLILFLYHNSTYSISTECISYCDAIFGGHNHAIESQMINGVPLLESQCNGRYVGHIQLEYDFDSNTHICSEYENEQVPLSTTADPRTNFIIESFDEEIAAISNQVCGYSSSTIYRDSIPYLYNKYTYRFFKEVLDTDNQYDIFLVESNKARSNLPRGNITYGDIYKALPFDNSLCLVKVSGSHLYNDMASYESGRYTIIETGLNVEAENIRNYLEDNEQEYYILAIDYIVTYEPYSSWMNIVEEYNDSDSLPRNIVAKYLYLDYPLQ